MRKLGIDEGILIHEGSVSAKSGCIILSSIEIRILKLNDELKILRSFKNKTKKTIIKIYQCKKLISFLILVALAQRAAEETKKQYNNLLKANRMRC